MEVLIRSKDSIPTPHAKARPRATAADAAGFTQTLQASQGTAKSSSLHLDTIDGPRDLDPERYFNPAPGTSMSELPVLLPSAANIQALSRHASDGVARMLADKGIPTPPASMTLDSNGQLQLPADYAYATQFRQALAEQPALAREINTVNGLSGVMADLKATEAQQGYTPTTALAGDGNAFRSAFAGMGRSPQITLLFGADGRLTVTADGEPLV